MRILAYFRSLGAKFFRGSQVADEMEEELRSHIEHRADDLERSGLDRATAERRARVEFGGQVRFKEESQEQMGGVFFETLMQDVRVALRVLQKSPGFTFAAAVTLALAVGANAVVFSVMNGLILRPLNVPQAESLYGIERVKDKLPMQSYPDYLDLRDRNRTFDGLAAYDIAQAALDADGNPARVWGVEATGNYFDVLRIRPYLGRVFHGSDEHGANSAPYLVLSYAYWHSHFSEDRGVVGRKVEINRHPFTILGVTPPGFQGTLLFVSPDFFVPVVNREQVEGESDLNARGKRWLFMAMGHLKPGFTPAQAAADLNAVGSYLEKTYPKDDVQMSFAMVRPSLLGDSLGGPVRAFLAGLMLLSALILLAACANLGSLFAARAADHAREVALRLALGASRARVLRGLFTEAMLIALLGGAVGLCGTVIVLRSLSLWQPFPRNFPVHAPVSPNASVYAVALLLTLASGLLFGIVPLRQVLRTDPYEIVKSGTRTTGRRRITVRDLLLTLQIAICAVLVTSSMVAVRGLARSLHSNFGFNPQNATLVDTDLHMAGYEGDQILAMQRRMIDAVRTIPGVKCVGLGDALVLDDGGDSLVFTEKTTDLRAANAAADASLYHVSPEYLQAEGTTLLTGRTFTWHDDQKSPRVAVVNREFTRKIFGSVAKALGGYYKMPDGTRVQVVGITEDGKYNTLTEEAQPAMFLAIQQWPSAGQTWLVLRSGHDSQYLGPSIRSRLRQLDARLPVYISARYKELDAALIGPRLATISLGVLGVMGAMLSVTGIFGMAAYSVSKRLKELGIRMALGAQRKEVLQAALGRAFKLLAIGSGGGLVLGLLASRVLAAIVYSATPRDPFVLAAVVLAMALLGLLATWIPAQRALSLDPARLLREE